LTIRVDSDEKGQEVIDVLNGWNAALAFALQQAGLPVNATETSLDPSVHVYAPSSNSAYPSSDSPTTSTSTTEPTSTTEQEPSSSGTTYNVNINVDVVINTQHAPFYDGSTGEDSDDQQDSATDDEYPSAYPAEHKSYPAEQTSYPAEQSSSDCVNPGSKTNFNLYDELGSLENTALRAAQAYATKNGLKVPDTDMWVRPKICNLPHMKCCADLSWRRDNRIRFPFVCGSAPVGCQTHAYEDAKATCVARGGYLCRGNAVSASMNDPTCPGTKTEFAWTLTRCDVNGVDGRVIRPSAGGAPGAMCETNLNAQHQTRCCSNVC
jgi:hypothetical protein